jgi:valine dehydrogenase (NAD+)
VDSTDELVRARIDVYAPCALGGALDDESVDALSASIVCGAANNQLAHPGVDKALADRGVLYAPDYLVNAGGVIQVGDEAANLDRGGFSFDRARKRAEGIYDTMLAILERSARDGVPPAVAADRLAEARMRDVGRLRGILLPGRV